MATPAYGSLIRSTLVRNESLRVRPGGGAMALAGAMVTFFFGVPDPPAPPYAPDDIGIVRQVGRRAGVVVRL